MAWARNGTPETGTGADADLDITDQTSTKYNNIMAWRVGNSSTGTDTDLRVGNSTIDTGTNYSYRRSINGVAYTSNTQTWIRISPNATAGSDQTFSIIYGINISTEEKLFIVHDIYAGDGSGAGTAPSRQELVGKWANTSNQFDKIRVLVAIGNLASDSNLSALGTD